MIPLKYTVEMEVPEEKVEQLKANPAGLTIDDLVQTKIETALFPLCQKGILVYRSEEGKKPADLFQVCPVCGHAWTAFHFSVTEAKQVDMSDGGIGVRSVLTSPTPILCSECALQNKLCNEALKQH